MLCLVIHTCNVFLPHLHHCVISIPLVMFYYVSDLGHVIGMYCSILMCCICFFHQPAKQCLVPENIRPHTKCIRNSKEESDISKHFKGNLKPNNSKGRYIFWNNPIGKIATVSYNLCISCIS